MEKEVTYTIDQAGRKWLEAHTEQNHRAQIAINSASEGFEVGETYTFRAEVKVKRGGRQAQWQVFPVTKQDLERQKFDRRRTEIARWMGYIEDAALKGYMYTKGLDTIAALGASDECADRIHEARITARRVNASQKAKEWLGYISEHLNTKGQWYAKGEGVVQENIEILQELNILLAEQLAVKLAGLQEKYSRIETLEVK